MATVGVGVTTLAALWGCPLACRYCFNPQSLSASAHVRTYTVAELYTEVQIDELYFLATGGGITFGGGEPALYADFIAEFRTLCGNEWHITLETSLNVPRKTIETLLPVINYYIVDCKECNNEIYNNYTGKDNIQMLANLEWLVAQGKSNNIRVRVPHIPNYNCETDIHHSVAILQKMGVKNIEVFSYTTRG